METTYSHSLYMYGPYSEEISSDLNQLASYEILQVRYQDQHSYRGYKILSGKKFNLFMKKYGELTRPYVGKISDIVNKFGAKTARELELRSTIIYLIYTEELPPDVAITRIKKIKPYLNDEEITLGFNELKELGYIH